MPGATYVVKIRKHCTRCPKARGHGINGSVKNIQAISMTKVIFNKESHTYHCDIEGEWVPFESVTTFLGRYSPPFPKAIIAPKSAAKNKREGKTPNTTEGILEKWESAGVIACDIGNAVHGAVEYYIKYGEFVKNKYLAEIVAKFSEIVNGRCAPEVILYDESLHLAGTADIIEKAEGGVNLIDLKTNGDLFDAKGKLQGPFCDLPASNFNKYMLQLNLYRHLLEGIGQNVLKMTILHVDGTDVVEVDVPFYDISEALKERAEEIKN